jgi:hypothetical protein
MNIIQIIAVYHGSAPVENRKKNLPCFVQAYRHTVVAKITFPYF